MLLLVIQRLLQFVQNYVSQPQVYWSAAKWATPRCQFANGCITREGPHPVCSMTIP